MNAFWIHRWRIAAGAVLLLSFCCIGLLLLPYVSGTLEGQQVLRSQNESIAFMADWQGQLKELEQQQNILAGYVNSSQSTMVVQQEFPSIIEFLFSAASESNIQLKRMTPSESTQGRLTQRSVSVECKGDYHEIALFINKIEQSKYVTRLDRLLLTKEDDGELSANFEVSFALRGDEL